MPKLNPALLLILSLSPIAQSGVALAARGDHDPDANPCAIVASTCEAAGFEGKDIWKKCVEPLKKGKKVKTSDGTAVMADVSDACKNAKAWGHKKDAGAPGSAPQSGTSGG